MTGCFVEINDKYKSPFAMERVILAETVKGTELDAYDILCAIDPAPSLLHNQPRLERLLDSYMKAITNLIKQKIVKREMDQGGSVLHENALARYQMIRNRRLMFRDFLHV